MLFAAHPRNRGKSIIRKTMLITAAVSALLGAAPAASQMPVIVDVIGQTVAGYGGGASDVALRLPSRFR